MAKGTGLYDILSGISEGIRGFAENRFKLRAYKSEQEKQLRDEALKQQALEQEQQIASERIQAENERAMQNIMVENYFKQANLEQQQAQLDLEGQKLTETTRTHKAIEALRKQGQQNLDEYRNAGIDLKKLTTTTGKTPEDLVVKQAQARYIGDYAKGSALFGGPVPDSTASKELTMKLSALKASFPDKNIPIINQATNLFVADIMNAPTEESVTQDLLNMENVSAMRKQKVSFDILYDVAESRWPGFKQRFGRQIQQTVQERQQRLLQEPIENVQ